MKMYAGIFFALLSFTLRLASQNYYTRSYTTEEGLPDQYVYSVTQGPDGFLWVATSGGLVSYDGQVFNRQKIRTDSGDFIFSACRSKAGNLWFGSYTGKLFFSEGGGAFRRIKDSLRGTVNRLVPSAFSNAVFIQSNGNGIFVLQGETLGQVKGTDEYQVNSFVEMEEGKLAVCTSEGLLVADLVKGTLTGIKGLETELSQSQKRGDKKNTVLVAIPGKGIAEVTLIPQMDGSVNSHTMLVLELKEEQVSAFYFNETDQMLYIGTRSDHLLCADLRSGKMTQLDENDYQGTAGSIQKDSEQNIWISTTGKGLYRLNKTAYEMLDLEAQPVFAINGDEQGTRFYGTAAGLAITRPGNKSIEQVESIASRKLGKVTSLYHDRRGNLWIGTENSGLFLVQTPSLKPIAIEFSSTPNIGINAINGNSQDSTVQVCTNLEGVYIYNGYRLQSHFSVLNSLLHNNVLYSLKTKKGRTYYATHNTSFNFSENGQIFEIDIRDNGYITDFNSFAESADGDPYIATNGGGVYVLNDTLVKPFDFNGKLESRYCSGLAFDAAGNLWIMQRYGLYRYYSKQHVLGKVNLMGGKQLLFNPNAVFTSASGDLYFGTSKGPLVFRSDVLKETGLLPRVYIRRKWLGDSVLEQKDSLKLPYGRYSFKFEFSALCLKNSEDVTFSYLLQGRDEEWSVPGRVRTVSFSNLSEGDYIFKVKAFNSEGFACAAPAEFSFSIKKPIWKNASFWIIMTLALVLTVFFIVTLRTAALIKAKVRLEKIVEEKTSELRHEKELVEAKNEIIEEQNNDITASITYARRIQEALLPDKNLSADVKSRIMIYYRPKDIVSGDFYWFAEKDGKFLVAACDCTGHGVPGAFMSMIGTTLLNKIVFDKSITGPDKILFEMDAEVTKSLHQENSAVNDGMEAGLCSIDFGRNEVVYSGAKRPMFLYRKAEEAYQLEEYKADKSPIGGFADVTNKVFVANRIQVNKGDMLYLFSDGVIDQFGENNKHFSTRRVRELLNSVAHLGVDEQSRHIHKVLAEWQGSTVQTDDILVLGIRI